MKIENIVFLSLLTILTLSIGSFGYLHYKDYMREQELAKQKAYEDSVAIKKGTFISCGEEHTIKISEVTSDIFKSENELNFKKIKSIKETPSDCTTNLALDSEIKCVMTTTGWKGFPPYSGLDCHRKFLQIKQEQWEEKRQAAIKKERKILTKHLLKSMNDVKKPVRLEKGTKILCRESGKPVLEVIRTLKSGSILSANSFKALNPDYYSLKINAPLNQAGCTIVYNDCWMTDKGLIGNYCD